MIRNNIAFVIVAAAILMISSGCSDNSFSFAKADQKFSNCLGRDVDHLLNNLSEQFELFLSDNGFAASDEEMLTGYKHYLQYLLDGKGFDTAWVFRIEALENLMILIEQNNFADLLKDEIISSCVLEITYPDQYLMARFRQIMPQHTVSPERFASEFIEHIDNEQFKDNVLKKMIAIEYFLGPVLHLLRPDKRYFAHN